MSYNTKNYTEQGGETTHIGGSLVIDEGGSVEGLPSVVAPVIVRTVAEDGTCGMTFKEIWQAFRDQGKIIFFVKDSESTKEGAAAPDYTRQISMVSKMSFENNLNYYLYLLNCATGETAGPIIGSANRYPIIH